MKTKLEIAREIINKVDEELLVLFEQRMQASRMVAEYKKDNDLPIFDAKREEELKERNCNLLKDKELKEYYLIFMEGLLVASKKYQKDLISE